MHGSAVDWVIQYRNINAWPEIIRALGGDPSAPVQMPIEREALPDARPAPAREWQEKAWQIVDTCEKLLWSPTGEKALAWLLGPKRCLHETTLRTWNVGYSSGMNIGGTYIERGITIPCIEDGLIWYVNIRRPSGKPKYRKLAGSITGLFGADTCIQAKDVFLCEGEFDAMLLWRTIANGFNDSAAGVITLGSATGRLDPATWGTHLMTAKRIFVCYDADGAGARGTMSALGLTARMRQAAIPVGMGKDITDFVSNGGDLLAWVKFYLEQK
jgi:hypothetical protein